MDSKARTLNELKSRQAELRLYLSIHNDLIIINHCVQGFTQNFQQLSQELEQVEREIKTLEEMS
jgi:hypothetical protein